MMFCISLVQQTLVRTFCLPFRSFFHTLSGNLKQMQSNLHVVASKTLATSMTMPFSHRQMSLFAPSISISNRQHLDGCTKPCTLQTTFSTLSSNQRTSLQALEQSLLLLNVKLYLNASDLFFRGFCVAPTVAHVIVTPLEVVPLSVKVSF